jgi:hypothetical protein
MSNNLAKLYRRKPVNHKKRTLTLYNPKENIRINFVWFKTVGVWTNRNPKSIMLAKEMVKIIQDDTLHNRKNMSFYNNWERVISVYKKGFNLEVEPEDI